ncbi:hypothetical protein FHS90_000020 [Rufibacter quisquiliarum]|uniref:Uncharacterized protein n=1 Tax=Rufibacter quisquiliarum TaxID=1549639 RepID=A0A839GCS2_9BACT|nr:hypothetical protein [Rufibacter quisquiliarum]
MKYFIIDYIEKNNFFYLKYGIKRLMLEVSLN